jgi:prepilin-type N-terminal cleavage/methylation domain-containing protein
VKQAGQKAFSLIELLSVISIIAILASLLLVSLASAKAKSRQAACINNLHQIGLGFTGFALDHEGKYPMDLAERLGGSLEYDDSRLITNTPFSTDFHHFAALSNEVPNVKIMVCPADRQRRPAKNYQTFTNDNLSYWANTKAQPHASLSTLAGDWNIHNTGASSNDIERLAFGQELHRLKGSVLFADGRVEITRTLAVAAPASPGTIAVTKPTPPTRDPAAGVPTTRSQPTSIAPTPAAPPSSPAQSTPPTMSAPVLTRASIDSQRTNTVANPPATPETQGRFGSVRRVSRNSEAVRPDPAPADDQQRVIISGDAPPTRPDEPWDTPGFHIFKLFAFVSYLISLLWAIIALLILYLRSRLAQREQERAGAVPEQQQ